MDVKSGRQKWTLKYLTCLIFLCRKWAICSLFYYNPSSMYAPGSLGSNLSCLVDTANLELKWKISRKCIPKYEHITGRQTGEIFYFPCRIVDTHLIQGLLYCYWLMDSSIALCPLAFIKPVVVRQNVNLDAEEKYMFFYPCGHRWTTKIWNLQKLCSPSSFKGNRQKP